MKVTLTFKSPDALEYGIRDAVEGEVARLGEDRYDDLVDEAEAACAKWVKYGEYVTIEIDTETGEARMLPVKP
jgi:hypothetical protein